MVKCFLRDFFSRSPSWVDTKDPACARTGYLESDCQSLPLSTYIIMLNSLRTGVKYIYAYIFIDTPSVP